MSKLPPDADNRSENLSRVGGSRPIQQQQSASSGSRLRKPSARKESLNRENVQGIESNNAPQQSNIILNDNNNDQQARKAVKRSLSRQGNSILPIAKKACRLPPSYQQPGRPPPPASNDRRPRNIGAVLGVQAKSSLAKQAESTGKLGIKGRQPPSATASSSRSVTPSNRGGLPKQQIRQTRQGAVQRTQQLAAATARPKGACKKQEDDKQKQRNELLDEVASLFKQLQEEKCLVGRVGT